MKNVHALAFVVVSLTFLALLQHGIFSKHETCKSVHTGSVSKSGTQQGASPIPNPTPSTNGSMTQNVAPEPSHTYNGPVFNGTKKKIKVKVVGINALDPTNERPYWPFYDLLKDRFEFDYSGNPDFVIYASPGDAARGYKDCVKIFVCGENAVPNFNKCDYALSYNPITFGDRHFIYKAYMYTEILFGPWDYHPKLSRDLTKRRFCSFIYRDHDYSLEGVVLREKFFNLLNKYKRIDSPGEIFNNDVIPTVAKPKGMENVEQWRVDKHEYISHRKFTIAFENTDSFGYTTEKLPDALRTHTIPIYFGNADVGKDYNKKAFIDVRDYDSLEDVVKKVIELDKDDDAYMAMLNEPPFAGTTHRSINELKDFFTHIFERGNKPFKKDPKKCCDDKS